MPPALIETLAAVADAMTPARDPWWIIGSAAVALHGVDARHVHDVDVLVSVNDAAAVMRAMGIAPLAMVPDPLFRSTTFSRWNVPPVPVEVMVGFEVCAGGHWHPVVPASRLSWPVTSGTVFVPDRDELIALLRMIGRPKDLMRARALEG